MRRLADSSMALALSVLASASSAQTIADYSRAQRTLLEATMAQAAARSAALAASAATPSASAATAAPSAPVPRAPEAPEAIVSVGGVFETPVRAVAEIGVNGTVYLLTAGQSVPGTPWRVDTVAVDRVVMTRPGSRALASHGEPTRIARAFSLPAPRWPGSEH
jgi:type IV pilus biogenesis protein PilP